MSSQTYCIQASYGSGVCYHGYSSFTPDYFEANGIALLYMSLHMLLLIAAIAGAILYSATQRQPWRLLLWGTALINVILAYVTVIGVDLIQAFLILLVAAIVSLRIPAVRAAQPA
jgi:hypothetical protein